LRFVGLKSQAIKKMLRQHKGSMAHLDRQLQADANQMPELDVEAFSNPLEVVVLFQPGPVGIQSDGAVVRCVSTAVASFLHAGWPSLPQSMRMAAHCRSDPSSPALKPIRLAFSSAGIFA
jgi:hypothetical protein